MDVYEQTHTDGPRNIQNGKKKKMQPKLRYNNRMQKKDGKVIWSLIDFNSTCTSVLCAVLRYKTVWMTQFWYFFPFILFLFLYTFFTCPCMPKLFFSIYSFYHAECEMSILKLLKFQWKKWLYMDNSKDRNDQTKPQWFTKNVSLWKINFVSKSKEILG